MPDLFDYFDAVHADKKFAATLASFILDRARYYAAGNGDLMHEPSGRLDVRHKAIALAQQLDNSSYVKSIVGLDPIGMQGTATMKPDHAETVRSITSSGRSRYKSKKIH